MDEAAVLARIALGTVFAVAAAGKLPDLPGTRKAAVEIGAPAVAAPALAWLVPAAGIAVAVAPPRHERAVGGDRRPRAAALLLRRDRPWPRGRTPPRLPLSRPASRAPVGTGTLARNFALALLAGFVVVAEGQ